MKLIWVALGSAVLAAAGMTALISMRNERNLFAEGAAKVSDKVGAAARSGMATATRPGDGVMRKCTIKGKTVISNAECAASNPTSKVIEIHDTKGFEAPKLPPKAPVAPTSNPQLDKLIEKQGG